MRLHFPYSLFLLGVSLNQAIASPTILISTPSPTSLTALQTLNERQALSTPAPSPTRAPANEYFLTTNYITIDGFTNAQVTNPPKTITLVLPTCSQTITPDKNGYVPPGTCGALYNYYPSFIAAIVVSVVFGMLSIGHIILAAKYKMVSIILSIP